MAPDLATVARALKEHIETEILNRPTPIGVDEDLFAAGFDSMSMTKILVFVEERFGVVIPDQDVDIDEVTTVDEWARFVHQRISSS